MDTFDQKGTAPTPVVVDDEADVTPGTPDRPRTGELFGTILQRRLERRGFLKGTAAVGAMAATPAFLASTADAQIPDNITFTPIADNTTDDIVVPDGYEWKVLHRWGDSLFSDTPDLDTSTLRDSANSETQQSFSGERQARQIGYNCDFIGYYPLASSDPATPGDVQFNSRNSSRGLFVNNHEYTNNNLIFVDWPAVRGTQIAVDVDLAAHGVSIVEISKTAVSGRARNWEYLKDSPFNRRFTGETPMEITGPAAGDALMQTSTDATGTAVNGTLNNCAGGVTPWGTVITCEENFDQYFGNFNAFAARAQGNPELEKIVEFHRRVPLPGNQSFRFWENVYERFDVNAEPTEAFRFGWCVEIDPYDPNFTPKKRTAIGRFKHEGATTVIAPSGQAVVYSGDDARFEYFFKFVSEGTYDPTNRDANLQLLDSGTLYVAKFNDDGTGEWLPLVFGQNGLDPSNGFNNQAEVLINSRGAGDVLGATPLDRPEDIEPSPRTGKVYVTLTNNSRRDGTEREAQGRPVDTSADAANPRGGSSPGNEFGHILEVIEAGDNPTSTTFTWEIFLLCGDPNVNLLTNPSDLANIPLPFETTYFAGFDKLEELSSIGSPDNIAFDRRGNLWISTDGQPGDLGKNDSVYACPTEGPNRGRVQQFLSGVVNCEICGPEFTPDSTTFFCGIQHPGDSVSLAEFPNFASDFPDGGGLPPRPTCISVVKSTGRRSIGS